MTNRWRRLLPLLPLVVGVLIGGALIPAALFQAVRFLLYALLVVLPVGYAVARWTLGDDLHPADRFRLAPVFGTTAVVVVSAIALRLHVPALLLVLPLVALGQLIQSLRAPDVTEEDPEPRADRWHLLLATVSLAFLALVFVIPSLPPTAARSGLVYQDVWFTMGNLQSLFRWGLPLRDIRTVDVQFGYHVAQGLFDAAAMHLARVDAFPQQIVFEPLWLFWMLAGVAVHAPRIFLGLRSLGLGVFAFGLLFTSDGTLEQHSNTYFCPISYAFSLPPFVLFSCMILGHLRGLRPLRPLAASLLFFGTIAAKGHLAILLPAALALTAGVRLIRTRVWPPRAEWTLALGIVIAGCLLRLTVFAGMPSGNPPDVELWPTFPTGFGYRLFYSYLPLGPAAAPAFALYRVVRSLLGQIGEMMTLVPLVLLVPVLWRCPRAREGMRGAGGGPWVFVLAFSLLSMGITSLAVVRGGMLYFRLFPSLLFLLMTGAILEPVAGLRAVRGAAYGVSAFGAFLLFVVTYRNPAHAWSALPFDDRPVWDARATVDRGEWDACAWVAAHTPADAVFFTNRRVFHHETYPRVVHRFMAFSALSGRQAWAEGEEFMSNAGRRVAEQHWTEVNELLDATPATIDKELADIRATWFVQSLRFDRRDFSAVKGLTLVYENASARVWRVQRPATP